MTTTDFYMNTVTGSVDTADNWIAEAGDDVLANHAMVKVRLASGEPVPALFDPAWSDKYEWVEVEH